MTNPRPPIEATRVILPPELWALSHSQRHHLQPLVKLGEKVLIKLVWRWEDFEAGLVERCHVCHGGETASIDARLADLYKQAGDSRCDSCYGVGFEGGFHAETYGSWMLAVDYPEEDNESRSGHIFVERPANVQFPHTPGLDQGDLIVRVDEWDVGTNRTPLVLGERSVLGTVTQQTIRTNQRNAKDTIQMVAQTARITNLPRDHAYYLVEMPESVTT